MRNFFLRTKVNVQLECDLQRSRHPFSPVLSIHPAFPRMLWLFWKRMCLCVLWDNFLMTDREMLTPTSQTIPIKTRRLWLMALLVCGFAQMGLHLSQDPCCLHSDPQRMVIHQLSFVNVRCFPLLNFDTHNSVSFGESTSVFVLM